MEHENDGDANSNLWARNDPQKHSEWGLESWKSKDE